MISMTDFILNCFARLLARNDYLVDSGFVIESAIDSITILVFSKETAIVLVF